MRGKYKSCPQGSIDCAQTEAIVDMWNARARELGLRRIPCASPAVSRIIYAVRDAVPPTERGWQVVIAAIADVSPEGRWYVGLTNFGRLPQRVGDGGDRIIDRLVLGAYAERHRLSAAPMPVADRRYVTPNDVIVPFGDLIRGELEYGTEDWHSAVSQLLMSVETHEIAIYRNLIGEIYEDAIRAARGADGDC